MKNGMNGNVENDALSEVRHERKEDRRGEQRRGGKQTVKQMVQKREQFGDYVVIDWNTDDEENIRNITDAIRDLIKRARDSGFRMIENSIYIVVQGAEKVNRDQFGYERHQIGSDQMTVGLRYEGTKWIEEDRAEEFE